MIALVYKGDYDPKSNKVSSEVIGYLSCNTIQDTNVEKALSTLIKNSRLHIGSDGLVYPYFRVEEAKELTSDVINLLLER